jgi:hypothetical protein
VDYPTDDRDPLETSLQDDADISVCVHKVGQAPRIQPVCIDLESGKVNMRAERTGTDLVIRDQNRSEGQLERQHPSIPPSHDDLRDLFHRERARAISFEGDNET